LLPILYNKSITSNKPKGKKMKNDCNFQVGQDIVFNFCCGEPQDNGVILALVGDNQISVLSEGVVLTLDVYADQVFDACTWDDDIHGD
jgi:hypothetical protein